jgi:hypothetical protein
MVTPAEETPSAEARGGSAVLPGRPDPIRIVPLRVEPELLRPLDAVAPAAAPHLTYRGGSLLTSVEVFTVFWGPDWTGEPLETTMTRLNDFFDFVLTSDLMDQLAEYSVEGKQIGHGRRTAAVTVSGKPPRVVSDRAIQHMLESQISAGAIPAATPNTLFFVYLPPGVTVVQGGSRSCQAFCGYHSDINGVMFYAAMPYPGCRGCTGDLDPFDALTSTSSHELCEAITDPVPGQGWYDDANGEIGDICAWKTRVLGQYTVQLEWSNRDNNCR